MVDSLLILELLFLHVRGGLFFNGTDFLLDACGDMFYPVC